MRLRDILSVLTRFLTRDIWLMGIEDKPTWFRRGIKLLRNLYLSHLRFQQARCSVRASSLTTVTLISVVPVLAFAFSLAKGFGAHQELQQEVITPALNQWLGTEKSPELRHAVDQVFLFVENTDLSNLGLVGLITVLYAVIRLLGAIEEAFNDLWGVESSRQAVRKLTDYLAVAVIVPIAVLLSAMVTVALEHGEALEWIRQTLDWSDFGTWIVRLLALPVVWLGFAIAYQVMPNTHIRFRSALNGGILGGTLWLLIHTAHVNLQVGVASYNAIYAGFSAFPIFIIWVYFSWAAVLVGAAFAAALQTEGEFREKVIRDNLDFYARERMALRLSALLAMRFHEDKGPLSPESICHVLHENLAAVHVAISDLLGGGLVVETREQEILLARDPSRTHLSDVLQAVKGSHTDVAIPLQEDALQAHRWIEAFEAEQQQLKSNQTLSDMARIILEHRPRRQA